MAKAERLQCEHFNMQNEGKYVLAPAFNTLSFELAWDRFNECHCLNLGQNSVRCARLWPRDESHAFVFWSSDCPHLTALFCTAEEWSLPTAERLLSLLPAKKPPEVIQRTSQSPSQLHRPPCYVSLSLISTWIVFIHLKCLLSASRSRI